MKILDGAELASYIQAEQARRVRSLRQSQRKYPELTLSPETLQHFAGIKQYGQDIGVLVTEGAEDSVSVADATAVAINWLLAGYNVNLPGKHIVIIDDDQTTTRSLVDTWRISGLEVASIKPDETVNSGELHDVEVLVDLSQLLPPVKASVFLPAAIVIGAHLDDSTQAVPKLAYAAVDNRLDALICAALFDVALNVS